MIELLCRGDQVRKETFKELELYQNNQILQRDFNFVGTIERGIKLNAIKSLRLLLSHIFTNINTFEYTKPIMLDLPCIL
jgi:hypothetical protein